MSGRVEGLADTLKAFERLGVAGKREAKKAITATTQKVRGDAIKSIQRGTKTGTVYERGPGQNLSPTHRASAAGEAPATDTGRLVGSAGAEVSGLTGKVKFTAKYATWLEYGTMKMDARPFLAPAVQANAQYLIDKLTAGINKASQEFNQS